MGLQGGGRLLRNLDKSKKEGIVMVILKFAKRGGGTKPHPIPAPTCVLVIHALIKVGGCIFRCKVKKKFREVSAAKKKKDRGALSPTPLILRARDLYTGCALEYFHDPNLDSSPKSARKNYD